MAMTNRNNAKLDCMIYYTLDELVPQDHLVRKMEGALDFRFIYPKVQHLYSRHGRPSIDPVVLSYYRTRSYSSNNSSFLFYLEVISYH